MKNFVCEVSGKTFEGTNNRKIVIHPDVIEKLRARGFGTVQLRRKGVKENLILQTMREEFQRMRKEF